MHAICYSRSTPQEIAQLKAALEEANARAIEAAPGPDQTVIGPGGKRLIKAAGAAAQSEKDAKLAKQLEDQLATVQAMLAEKEQSSEAARAEAVQMKKERTAAMLLRTRWTIESNSVVQQNLIGYLIASLKLNLRGEKESKIHIPSW